MPPLHRYGLGDTIRFTGSTHDEGAVITKHPPTVGALNHHLAAKIEEHLDELEIVTADLQPGAGTLVVSYGVTAGAARLAVARARDTGIAVSHLVIASLWPVPEAAIGAALEGIDRIVVAGAQPGPVPPRGRAARRRRAR